MFLDESDFDVDQQDSGFSKNLVGRDSRPSTASNLVMRDMDDDENDGQILGSAGSLGGASSSRARTLAQQREIQLKRRQSAMQSGGMVRSSIDSQAGFSPKKESSTAQFTPAVRQFSAPKASRDTDANFESSEFSRPAIKNDRNRRDFDDDDGEGGYGRSKRDTDSRNSNPRGGDRRGKTSSQPVSRQNTRPWDDDDDDDEDYPPQRGNNARDDRDDRDVRGSHNRDRDNYQDNYRRNRRDDDEDDYPPRGGTSRDNRDNRDERDYRDREYRGNKDGGRDGGRNGGRDAGRDVRDNRSNRDGYRSSNRRHDDYPEEDEPQRRGGKSAGGDKWDTLQNKKAAQQEQERDPYRTRRDDRDREEQEDRRPNRSNNGNGGRGDRDRRSQSPVNNTNATAATSSTSAATPNFQLNLTNKRSFLTIPVPKAASTVQCYIRRNKSGTNKLFPVYTLYLKDGDRFLLQSRKRANNRTSNYLISMGEGDFSRDSSNFLGKLRSNFVGTEFQVFDNGTSPKDGGDEEDNETANSGNNQPRKELAGVMYAANVLGSRGPRKMQVCVPAVDEQDRLVTWRSGQAPVEDLVARMKDKNLRDTVYMINKPPRWNEQVGAYVLNFNGRVTMASVKNFQLVDPDEQNAVLLQFGRVGKDEFTMDFQWPLTPLQAFGITLSSFDSKIACD